MRTIPLLVLAVTCRAEDALGTWKMNPARSTSNGRSDIEALTVRVGPHAKGEVFTVDKTARDGRATTSSSILYFDGKPHDFEGTECTGTQTSRRVDKETVEIIRRCNGGGWIRFVRRLVAQPMEMILEIAEQRPDGRRLECRLVMEKHEQK